MRKQVLGPFNLVTVLARGTLVSPPGLYEYGVGDVTRVAVAVAYIYIREDSTRDVLGLCDEELVVHKLVLRVLGVS